LLFGHRGYSLRLRKILLCFALLCTHLATVVGQRLPCEVVGDTQRLSVHDYIGVSLKSRQVEFMEQHVKCLANLPKPTVCSGQLSLLSSAGWELSSGLPGVGYGVKA